MIQSSHLISRYALGMSKKVVYIPVDAESLAAHLKKKQGAMKTQEFADHIGVTRALVDLWKKGKNWPGPRFLPILGLAPMFEVLDDAPFPRAADAVVKKGAAKKSGRNV